ncbi:MAG: hypothetical protein QW795_03365 [Candidatus Bathyarchaeia archaeon]
MVELSDWKEKRLGEILTSSQIKELKKLVKENIKSDPTSHEFIMKLKEMFNKWRKELLSKEVEPDYLTYAFAYSLSKISPEARLPMLEKEEIFAKKLEETI